MIHAIWCYDWRYLIVIKSGSVCITFKSMCHWHHEIYCLNFSSVYEQTQYVIEYWYTWRDYWKMVNLSFSEYFPTQYKYSGAPSFVASWFGNLFSSNHKIFNYLTFMPIYQFHTAKENHLAFLDAKSSFCCHLVWGQNPLHDTQLHPFLRWLHFLTPIW